MTSTSGTAQHPEIDEISDLTEGLLSPSRTAEVLQHVASCDLCAEVRDSLEEVRRLLGSLPDPEPMPADIAARIDAALADQPRPTGDEPLDVSRETATGATPSSTLRAPFDGGGASVSPPGRPAGRSTAPTGPGRRTFRRRRRAAVLGTAVGAAVIGMGVFFLQAVGPSQDASQTASDRQASAVDSGPHRFTDGTLEARVQALVRGRASPKSPGAQKMPPNMDSRSTSEAAIPETEATSNPLRAPAVAVPPCVQQATGRNAPALALDEGEYRGAEAFLVVLPHSSDPARVEAYIVAASCVDTAPESAGRLLLSRAYDRP
ncbi:hypothetical protein [Streptomyces pratensis]|uniref:anti-sigma factor family protein n=1 Tax=Streptomyces pratensis TaxID=1169025 RepID=UPI00301A5B84